MNSRKKMKSLPREWVQLQAENDAGKMKCSTGYSNDDLNSSRISGGKNNCLDILEIIFFFRYQ